MKRLIFFYMVLAVALLLGACRKDFLTTKSESEFTDDVVFSNATYTNYALTGCYSLLTTDELYSSRMSLMYSDMNTDIEVTSADANSYNVDGQRGLANYMATSGNTEITKPWNVLYKLIERANLCIKGIQTSPAFSGADADKMKAYLGEALTLRALAYYELVRNWGDVPFKTEPTKSDLSNVYLPVTSRDTIYDHILTDLKTAEDFVPWIGSGTSTTSERISKGFVKGLRARIALSCGGYSIRNKPGYPTERRANWRDYYEIANQECKEIYESGRHALTTDFVTIWRSLGQYAENPAKENLFEAAMGLARSGETGYSIGIRVAANTKWGFSTNSNVVSTNPYYFYSFDSTDLRKLATVGFYSINSSAQEAFQGATNPCSWTFAKWDQRFNGAAWQTMNKAANGKFGYGINWCLMRYADALLMYAETENELNNGPTAAAITALKAVRQRAFAQKDWAAKVDAYIAGKSAKDAFFNAIVDERAWEFGGEGVRKFDLIRWNLLVKKIQDQRDGLNKMLDEGAAPNGYTVPSNIYWKLNADNETIDRSTINFYTELGSGTITGFTKTAWMSGFSADNKTTYKDLLTKFSSGLNANGVTNRHLYPISASAISDSKGLLNNSYGF